MSLLESTSTGGVWPTMGLSELLPEPRLVQTDMHWWCCCCCNSTMPKLFLYSSCLISGGSRGGSRGASEPPF